MGGLEIRGEMEIQRAHDILDGALRGKVPGLVIEEEDRTHLKFARDALCWVLKHERNPHFARNLARIEERAAEQGLEMHCRLT